MRFLAFNVIALALGAMCVDAVAIAGTSQGQEAAKAKPRRKCASKASGATATTTGVTAATTTSAAPAQTTTSGATGVEAGQGAFAFRCQNGRDAQEAAKTDRLAGTACTDGEIICLADGQLGQCVAGSLVGTACAGGLACQALPLRNNPGISPSCTTAEDRDARIAEALQSC